MIVRSGVKLSKLFETIYTSGFLGTCDKEAMERFKKNYPDAKITQNPHDREGILGLNGSVDSQKNVFVVLMLLIRRSLLLSFFNQRFNRIEEAFRETEGIKQSQLRLEWEQAELKQADYCG